MDLQTSNNLLEWQQKLYYSHIATAVGRHAYGNHRAGIQNSLLLA
jgi:hypothetical protein